MGELEALPATIPGFEVDQSVDCRSHRRRVLGGRKRSEDALDPHGSASGSLLFYSSQLLLASATTRMRVAGLSSPR